MPMLAANINTGGGGTIGQYDHVENNGMSVCAALNVMVDLGRQ